MRICSLGHGLRWRDGGDCVINFDKETGEWMMGVEGMMSDGFEWGVRSAKEACGD